MGRIGHGLEGLQDFLTPAFTLGNLLEESFGEVSTSRTESVLMLLHRPSTITLAITRAAIWLPGDSIVAEQASRRSGKGIVNYSRRERGRKVRDRFPPS